MNHPQIQAFAVTYKNYNNIPLLIASLSKYRSSLMRELQSSPPQNRSQTHFISLLQTCSQKRSSE